MLIKTGLHSEHQTQKLKHYFPIPKSGTLKVCSAMELLLFYPRCSLCCFPLCLFSLSFACLVFYFFLKYAFTRDTTSFTDRLSCVLLQICCRARWSQLCLALVFSCYPHPKPHWTHWKHYYIYTVTQFLI